MPKLSIFGKTFSEDNFKSEPFLALELSEEKRVKAAIWQITKNQKYKILKTAIKKYEGGWVEVISEISELILSLVKEEDLENKVKKVIFGLPKNFIEGEAIKKEYLANFKKLCQKLSLTPLGFVEIPQAIALLLKEREGRPQTAILLKAAKTYFSVNVFKIGKEIGSKTVFYKENIAVNLSQALKEFSELQTFPAKILLYDAEEDLEEIKQELLSYPWQREAGFLHFPKIEILDKDFSIAALIAGGMSEFTKESEKEEVSSQELGFLKDEDIVEKEAALVLEEKKTRAVKGEIKEEEKNKELVKKEIKKEEGFEIEEGEFEEEGGWIEGFKSFFSNIPWRLNFKRIIPALFVLGAILGGFIYYLYWIRPQAKVKIFVEPYSLEKDAEIILNLALEGLDETSELPGKEVSVEKIGSEKIGVSSKKEVGESAKGEVTIYNKTKNVKSFSKGIIIIGPKELKFTLDEDVSVASVSDEIIGTAGKKNVKATAVEIGPEGNLGAGSDFTFKDFPISSYAARNEKVFSGGTSREVAVVGEKDQNELLKTLKEKLSGEAKEELEAKLGSSERLLSETIEEATVKKKFSHDIEDEASELMLDLTMSFTAVSYNEEDLTSLLEKMAEESAPSNYKFDKEEVEMEVTSIEKKEGKILFNAHFKVNLIPEIEEEELKEKLAGKNSKEVNQHLRTMTNISGFEIEFDSRLPFMGKTLPFNSQKIFIEILPY